MSYWCNNTVIRVIRSSRWEAYTFLRLSGLKTNFGTCHCACLAENRNSFFAWVNPINSLFLQQILHKWQVQQRDQSIYKVNKYREFNQEWANEFLLVEPPSRNGMLCLATGYLFVSCQSFLGYENSVFVRFGKLNCRYNSKFIFWQGT